MTLIAFCVLTNLSAQIHHNIQDNATYAVERIAKFSVSDAPKDVLEIVNGTQYNNQFVPNIWAHRESDNRIAFNVFSSIKSNVDNGSAPIFTFRAELRNSIYDSHPYPWGSTAAQVQNRPLFSWANYNSTKMLMKANGYLGLGTISPSTQLHTTGTLRFQNLPNATTPTYILGTDANGNVKEYPAISSNGNSDSDWYKVERGSLTSINDNIYTLGNVGINTSIPIANLHSKGTVRFENLPSGYGNLQYLLGVDGNGVVKKYKQLTIFLKGLKEIALKQQNQITLLQNQLSELKKSSTTNVLKGNGIKFSSNYPNPFSEKTIINYTLSKETNTAKIFVYDINGRLMDNYDLKERRNESKLVISKKDLKPGIYFYTLIADDIVIGTKKMIVK